MTRKNKHSAQANSFPSGDKQQTSNPASTLHQWKTSISVAQGNKLYAARNENVNGKKKGLLIPSCLSIAAKNDGHESDRND